MNLPLQQGDNRPQFTVLMAVCRGDDSGLFYRAIESIYHNSVLPDRVLLVVDGPVPPSTESVIIHYQTARGLDVVRLAKNQGLAGALNHGLHCIDTEWVVRADSDDINLPDRFEALIGMMAQGYDLIGSAVQEVERDGFPLAVRSPPTSGAEIVKFCRYRNPFNHMTVAFRHHMAIACGGYPRIHLKEDYGLWATMIRYGARCANLAQVTVLATAGRDMYKRRGGWRYASAEMAIQQHLVRQGLKSIPAAIVHGLLRATVFLLPWQMRAAIYEYALRVRPERK